MDSVGISSTTPRPMGRTMDLYESLLIKED